MSDDTSRSMEETYGDRGDRDDRDDSEEGLSKWVAIVISALVGVVVAYLSIWWATGQAVFYEGLFRVAPTYQGPNRGIGADWVTGNTIPALDFLIALTHAADVIMGAFILLMVFIHWAAFRRLAARMRQPGESERDAVVTDGGSATEPARVTGEESSQTGGGDRR